MKPIQIAKMIVNILFLMLIISLICFYLTGVVFHEIAGIILLCVFITHLTLNFRWIAGVTKKLYHNTAGKKLLCMYVLNVLLFICMITVFITGLCISQVIIPQNDISLILSVLHKWMAYICFTLCIFHTALHYRYIIRFFKTLRTANLPRKIWSAASAFGAISIISGIIYSQSVFGLNGNTNIESINSVVVISTDTGLSTGYEEKADEDEEKEGTTIQNDQETVKTVSLSDFLGKLYCTACPKHCSLLSPRCGRGQSQVQQAKAEYQEIYEIN